jgi:heme/copper-type cytochrome/quinol oxidase subunit 2
MAKRDARRIQRRRQRIRQVVFAGVVVVVLGAAIFYLGRAFDRPELAPIAGNVIDIAADMSGFDETEIRVPVGEPVTMRLTSRDTSAHTDGGGKHQWAVDELAVSIVAPPLASAYATFTPSQPGQYTFYCDVCCGGRANPTMQGTLIVEA